jgi:hypothetical protein
MKRYINYFFAIATGLIFLIACNENEFEYNKGEEPLTLTANKTDIQLEPRTPDSEALSFSWTTGTNSGTNSAISYTLQIDKQGNNFNGGVSIDIGRRIYTHKYTHVQLNNLLLGDFSVAPGASINLEARMLALVASENANDQISETVSFTVKSHKSVSTTLYLIGDATPGGWNLDNATPLNPVSKNPGGFVTTVDMKVGNFKFVTTKNNLLPSYNRDGNVTDLRLVLRENSKDPDEQFQIQKAAKYRISVNILDLTITLEELKTVGPKYTKMYLVGDLTGWSFREMRQDAFDPFVFRYGGVLSGSGDRDFKFGTSSGSWANMLHPTVANAPITHTQAMFDDTGDYKWVLSSGQNNKPYKIAINISESKERMDMTEYTPYTTLYVIGQASPIGWSLDRRQEVQMTKGADDFTYTWTGALSTGEIKFKCSDDNSWDNSDKYPWYMAHAEDTSVTPGTEMILTPGVRGSGDRKWIVQEAGNYTITINQLTETILFTKK